MNKINSIITLRHFEKDEPLIIYSPELSDKVSMQMFNKIAKLNVYVYDDDSFYDLDKEITYGSNSYIIDHKPSSYRDLYVNVKDIIMIQEADIDLDNH
ncbi:hypothetical protein [Lactobacillus johnsonii]|uniref:hypothetical protein n=1 Tax=Lactobacillus johnsonii TaxID=33959 RepID=UPI001FB3312C|nr:hypothetical protein [Lactobacillus johnsonii]UOC07200.1 hypothetical protein LC811_05115 [Lactobacillus johnsonii]